MYLFIISLICIFSNVSGIPTVRLSSKCSVPACTHSSLFNCASNENLCYNFQTTNGTNFCAPASSCELLDLCDKNGDCLSNTSICIVNSCCIQPRCLPLILINLCSSNNIPKDEMNEYTTVSRLSTTSAQTSTDIERVVTTENEFITENSQTTEGVFEEITSSKINFSTQFQYQEKSLNRLKPSSAIFHPKICPTAYWNSTEIIVASFPDISPRDFFINQYDEIYIPDNTNHIIRKYSPEDDDLWTIVTKSMYFNESTAIFVDLNENIYIWDSKSYRIINNSQILLSFDGCKNSPNFNQICFGNSLFVDFNNSIYISESAKNSSFANRVMKFEFNNKIGRIIAGTYTSGSGIKQLNSPGKIFVDKNGILYVADIDNSRIQQFSSGNRHGKTILSVDGLTDFIMDEDENLFVMIKSKNLVKRNEKNIIEFLNQPIRMHFGIDGSIYILEENIQNIKKFQIMDNIC